VAEGYFTAGFKVLFVSQHGCGDGGGAAEKQSVGANLWLGEVF